MKTWATAFLNHMLGRTTSLTTCGRIIRVSDGLTFGRTECTRNLSIDGVTYYANAGLVTSVVQKTDTLAVDTIDVTAFMDDADEGEIEAGIWDGSRFTLFEVRWDSPPLTFNVNQMNIIRDGILGTIDRQDQRFIAEISNKMTRFDTHFGAQYTVLCPWVVGDPLTCGVDMTPFTHTGTITSLGANRRLTFSASALTQPPGYFDQGRITFTSGPNTGYSMDVRHWNNKRFDMNRPLPYAATVGNTFTAVRGDDHTFKTCKDVFNRVQRHRGFIHLPGIDKLLENPVHWATRPVPIVPPDGNPGNDPGSGEGGEGSDGGDGGEGGGDGGDSGDL